MQMRSRKQRQQGRRSRSRCSMKGGAGKPYKCEGVPLIVGNPLIQIAVTQEENETYNFNVPAGGVFQNYCQLAQYYEQNVPLACVNPSFVNASGKNMMVPSLVKILGLALLLHNATIELQKIGARLTDMQIKPCLDALILMVNSGRSLFTATASGCIVSDDFKTTSKKILQNYEFYKVHDLNQFDVDSILKYFKLAIFYYKFGVLPDQYLDVLKINAILMDDPRSMAKFTVDDTKLKETIAIPSFQLYKKVFYTQENLSAPSAPAPAPVASSAPAPVAMASGAPVEDKSTDARLAALETAVASIQQSVAAIQAKLA